MIISRRARNQTGRKSTLAKGPLRSQVLSISKLAQRYHKLWLIEVSHDYDC